MLIRSVLIAAGLLTMLAMPVLADRTMTADIYLDRLHAMWLGEMLGNYAGRPKEGSGARGGFTYTVPWTTLVTTNPWSGDDDTVFEYMYDSVLNASAAPTPTNAEIKTAWETYVPLPSFYIANKQARWLMGYGFAPPETGSIHHNVYWYAIDSQITTEAIGAAALGMRQQAADLVKTFGSVTNDGFAVHAAQFYAAMYAAAPLETSVETVVEKGLAVVPQTSRTYQAIQDVRAWYAADKLDDGVLDWRATQAKVYDKYYSDDGGRYRGWVESAINTAMTTLALLYGQDEYGHGDFEKAVEIAVQAGFDCDCNPATVGGLIGLMEGMAGLPAVSSDNYYAGTLTNITKNTSMLQIALDWQQAAERQILAAGGTIEGTGAARTYHLPSSDDVTPPPEKSDPAGPKGLVAEVLARGGTVTVSASIAKHDPTVDRDNLEQIIDGITDVSYNGHLPYSTDNGDNAQPAGDDWYQLNFDREVRFDSLIFYEGDTRIHINTDPRASEPYGGYFDTLIVEVGQSGVFTSASNLVLSEALDPYKFYQVIELQFDPVIGDAIRIRGQAGGQYEFTTILELEAYGVVPEPATLGMVVGGLASLLVRRRRG